MIFFLISNIHLEHFGVLRHHRRMHYRTMIGEHLCDKTPTNARRNVTARGNYRDRATGRTGLFRSGASP